MRVLISGASGLIGSSLTAALVQVGHHVSALVRSAKSDRRGNDPVHWDPAAGTIDSAKIESLKIDAVVHLAGENIASGRWSARKKAAIRDSRVHGTRLLAQTFANLATPPRVLVSASAVGFYGDRGDDVLTESSAPGSGFLADVCQEWERAADPAREAGIRVVHPRFGLVLSTEGGALAKMLPVFRLGLGGRLGNGRNFQSWIDIKDVVGAIEHLLSHADLDGPFNVTAPSPVTNRAFTQSLATVLRRPALLPVPRFALQLLLGDMADQALLSSVRAMPRRLREGGYTFRYDSLEGSFQRLLGKDGKDASRTFFT